jgi:tetratricopeptide (TPR) repeat protein
MSQEKNLLSLSVGCQGILCVVLSLFVLSSCSLLKVSIPVEEKGRQRAALTLLDDAEKELQSGNDIKAEEYLERAIRIEPQNAVLWQALAKSKFQQGLYSQAIQLCHKSNSYLPSNVTRRNNWLLIEQAYLELGNVQEAQKARARVK